MTHRNLVVIIFIHPISILLFPSNRQLLSLVTLLSCSSLLFTQFSARCFVLTTYNALNVCKSAVQFMPATLGNKCYTTQCPTALAPDLLVSVEPLQRTFILSYSIPLLSLLFYIHNLVFLYCSCGFSVFSPYHDFTSQEEYTYVCSLLECR